MGLVCKKRAADGLSYLSFTTVAQLSSDKGGACIPLEKTLTHPPTPFLDLLAFLNDSLTESL